MNYKEYVVKVFEDGTKWWCLNGLLHRENGPAVEHPDGYKEWRFNGYLHREDGPAVERANGTKYWLTNGKRHREDGPAVEHPDGTKEWWLEGYKYSQEDWEKEMKKAKEVSCEDKVIEIDGKKYKLVSI